MMIQAIDLKDARWRRLVRDGTLPDTFFVELSPSKGDLWEFQSLFMRLEDWESEDRTRFFVRSERLSRLVSGHFVQRVLAQHELAVRIKAGDWQYLAMDPGGKEAKAIERERKKHLIFFKRVERVGQRAKYVLQD